jgi:hypothetical protein
MTPMGPKASDAIGPLARLHQRDREPDCRAAAGLPQRPTLARCTNGLAMDGNCDAGGREKLSPFEGPHAASDSEGRVAAPSAITAR